MLLVLAESLTNCFGLLLKRLERVVSDSAMPKDKLISIVEDDNALRISLEDLIQSVGYRVQGFSSAEAFLGSNQLHETACLVLDLRLPGMSGLELEAHLAAVNSRIPTIFITAHGDENLQSRALASGASAFLHKPCYEQDLLNAIVAALGRS
jgi:FixJ family two-component response regulator